jgi:hypothetical protein
MSSWPHFQVDPYSSASNVLCNLVKFCDSLLVSATNMNLRWNLIDDPKSSCHPQCVHLLYMVLGCEYPQWFHEIVTLLLHNLQISLHKNMCTSMILERELTGQKKELETSVQQSFFILNGAQ